MIQFLLSLLLLLLTLAVSEDDVFELCLVTGKTKYLPEHWDCWRSSM